jgi:hypothetical protein
MLIVNDRYILISNDRQHLLVAAGYDDQAPVVGSNEPLRHRGEA